MSMKETRGYGFRSDMSRVNSHGLLSLAGDPPRRGAAGGGGESPTFVFRFAYR